LALQAQRYSGRIVESFRSDGRWAGGIFVGPDKWTCGNPGLAWWFV